MGKKQRDGMNWVPMPAGYYDLQSPDGEWYMTVRGWVRYSEDCPRDGLGYWQESECEKAYAAALDNIGHKPWAHTGGGQ